MLSIGPGIFLRLCPYTMAKCSKHLFRNREKWNAFYVDNASVQQAGAFSIRVPWKIISFRMPCGCNKFLPASVSPYTRYGTSVGRWMPEPLAWKPFLPPQKHVLGRWMPYWEDIDYNLRSDTVSSPTWEIGINVTKITHHHLRRDSYRFSKLLGEPTYFLFIMFFEESHRVHPSVPVIAPTIDPG